MTKKKKKAKRFKSSIDFEKDGKKLWKNFNSKPVKVNVFDKARSIKTWRQLQHILESYAPGVAYPSTVAEIILKHVRDNWNTYKIFKDPDQYGAIVVLVNFVTKVGAPKAYNSQHLKIFCRWTGYKKPKTLKTFKNDMTTIKEFLGVKRIHTGYHKYTYTKEEIEKEKEWIRILEAENKKSLID
tara:strand:- start:487 stop:1038 length:552 start_codon:yes stop_codon:yes gene_type:complete